MCETCGCGDPEVVPIEIQTNLLAENDRIAHHNREHFEAAGVLAIGDDLRAVEADPIDGVPGPAWLLERSKDANAPMADKRGGSYYSGTDIAPSGSTRTPVMSNPPFSKNPPCRTSPPSASAFSAP